MQRETVPSFVFTNRDSRLEAGPARRRYGKPQGRATGPCKYLLLLFKCGKLQQKYSNDCQSPGKSSGIVVERQDENGSMVHKGTSHNDLLTILYPGYKLFFRE